MRRIISYNPYRGWLAGAMPICSRGAPSPSHQVYPPENPILLPWIDDRPRTKSSRQRGRTTMPYQQGQPTSCFSLLTTHLTIPSSAIMSTHT